MIDVQRSIAGYRPQIRPQVTTLLAKSGNQVQDRGSLVVAISKSENLIQIHSSGCMGFVRLMIA